MDVPAHLRILLCDGNASLIILLLLLVTCAHGNKQTNKQTNPVVALLGMIYDQFFDFSRQLNVNVMAYEYSGYGKATGTPSEANCYADIDAAFKYLVEVRCGCIAGVRACVRAGGWMNRWVNVRAACAGSPIPDGASFHLGLGRATTSPAGANKRHCDLAAISFIPPSTN